MSSIHICELAAAARDILSSGRNLAACSAVDFPLPTFSDALRNLREDLLRGRGFVLLKGLALRESQLLVFFGVPQCLAVVMSFSLVSDPCRYTSEEAGAMFYALGCHLGSPRSQNAQGHMLGHVRESALYVGEVKYHLSTNHVVDHIRSQSSDSEAISVC